MLERPYEKTIGHWTFNPERLRNPVVCQLLRGQQGIIKFRAPTDSAPALHDILARTGAAAMRTFIKVGEEAVTQALSSGRMCGTATLLLAWKPKGMTQRPVVLVGRQSQGKVLALAQATFDRVNGLSQLKASQAYKLGTKDQKEAWSERLVQHEKPLWAWQLTDMHTCTDELYLILPLQEILHRGGKVMEWPLSSEDLQDTPPTVTAAPNLESTASFLMSRLSVSELRKLGIVAKSLHNHTVRIGTTCSGTDICVPAVAKLLQCVAQKFEAAGAACGT